MRINRLVQPLALATLLFVGAGSVNAQTVNWNPRTGDVWVDTQLADINRYGTSYRDPFIDEMVRYGGAPRDFITDLLVNRRWSAGDVYYACAIAQATNRPCREVADQWEQNRGQGWGVVAQRMGIKPGSAEFHRLKKGFVPTYDRWARPIVLDDDLKRAYPNRVKNKGSVRSHSHAKGAVGSHAHVNGKVAGKSHAGKASSASVKAKASTSPAKSKAAASGRSGKSDGAKGGKASGQGKGNGKP